MPGRPGLDGLSAQMIQFQQHMVRLRAGTPAFEDLQQHGTGHYVPARKILGRGRIPLHEPLAVLVDQVATLSPGSLR